MMRVRFPPPASFLRLVRGRCFLWLCRGLTCLAPTLAVDVLALAGLVVHVDIAPGPGPQPLVRSPCSSFTPGQAQVGAIQRVLISLPTDTTGDLYVGTPLATLLNGTAGPNLTEPLEMTTFMFAWVPTP